MFQYSIGHKNVMFYQSHEQQSQIKNLTTLLKHFLNVQVICEMTNGGVDYSFDCTGDVGVIYSALESATPVSSKRWNPLVFEI